MNQIIDFFRNLLSTREWPARWKCGEWTDFHGWLYIISDLMIWTAYFMIPVIILNYISKKNTALKFNKAYIYFAAFILLCGTTHFFDAVMFWVPMYRLNALLRIITAIVSLFTVYHLIKILPEAFQQKTNIELEGEIQRRKEAEWKLAEANKGLEAFAYIASHDLQEPLRKIGSYSYILFNENAEKFDEKSKGLANKIISASERMQTMIRDVLSLSTLNSDVRFSMVDIKKPITSATTHLELKIQEKNALVEVADMPQVMGNEAYLSQLFLNLIANALKFSKERPVIKIHGELRQDKIVIYVSDNGIGIKEEELHKIFDSFQRLNPRSEYEGSGIGLAICKRIIDIHKGSIEVKSKVGEGTVFIVTLPSV